MERGTCRAGGAGRSRRTCGRCSRTAPSSAGSRSSAWSLSRSRGSPAAGTRRAPYNKSTNHHIINGYPFLKAIGKFPSRQVLCLRTAGGPSV